MVGRSFLVIRKDWLNRNGLFSNLWANLEMDCLETGRSLSFKSFPIATKLRRLVRKNMILFRAYLGILEVIFSISVSYAATSK